MGAGAQVADGSRPGGDAHALWAAPHVARFSLAPARELTLPAATQIVDLETSEDGATFVLGRYASLDRIEGERVTRVADRLCVSPRPKDLDPEAPWPSFPDFGFGLSAERDGLMVLLAHPGASGYFYYAARVAPDGREACALPPFYVGSSMSGALRSGGRLWFVTYGEVAPVFPSRALGLPVLDLEGRLGGYVAVGIPGAPPAHLDEEARRLRRYDGVRWQELELELPDGTLTETLVVDESGTMWGLAAVAPEPRVDVIRHDGKMWQRIPSELLGAFAVLPARGALWVVGTRAVTLWTGAALGTAEHGLPVVDRAFVDRHGRLWVFGRATGGPAARDPEAESDRVARLSPVREAR